MSIDMNEILQTTMRVFGTRHWHSFIEKIKKRTKYDENRPALTVRRELCCGKQGAVTRCRWSLGSTWQWGVGSAHPTVKAKQGGANGGGQICQRAARPFPVPSQAVAEDGSREEPAGCQHATEEKKREHRRAEARR